MNNDTISRSAVVSLLRERAKGYDALDECTALSFKTAAYEVSKMPTIDAVPVVRCKDCRYWERFNNTSLGTCYHGIYAGSNLGTPENHYCASAARMDGGDGE